MDILTLRRANELSCWERPPPQFTVSLSLEGQVMEQVKAFNYLGIQIGCPLSFSQNADAVCKKPQHDLLKEI